MDLFITELVQRALAEDAGQGDVTSLATIRPESRSVAIVLAKQDLVLAGLDAARAVFRVLDPDIQFSALVQDGDRVASGSHIAKLTGNTRSLLAGERVALNLLQHLSGIATHTERFVANIAGLKARVVDTRKTLPGLRRLEKYAVRMGGGTNHRFGLSDGVLIKDNHITACGGITKAVQQARANVHHLLKIEVETKNIGEVKEALAAGADIIMLDNMPAAMMREAVAFIAGRAIVEASGNVTLENIRTIAETGVDLISTGSVTHSAPAADISMKIQ